MISEPRVCSVQNVHLCCVLINTVFKQTETSFHLPMSARSTIGCVQNDFRAYGTFGTNCAPIFWILQMLLQGDMRKVEARFDKFEDSVNLGVR
jgi:hypothetical protein